MIDIIINSLKYSLPVMWDEISLDEAMSLETLTDKLPDSLKEYFAVMYEPSAAHGELFDSECGVLADFYARVLSLLSKMPLELAMQTEPQQVAQVVEKYLSHFIVSVIFEPVFEPQGIESFMWQGEELLLPRTRIGLNGQQIEGYSISAEEFCVVSDLYTQSKVRYAAMIVATLCRPRGEAYDVQMVIRRARTMSKLPMSIVLEVFFCSYELTSL